jgi:hypothetical protein
MRSTTASKRLRRVSFLALAAVLFGGCAIDVDLSSSPSSVAIGQPVNFDVSVRNRTTCPVGGVVAVLVPFVPKDYLISQIQDPMVRQELSDFVDAFCSGMNVQPPDGSANCRIENGELICDLTPSATLPGPLPETAVATTEGGAEISCGSDGTKITCRFPSTILDQAQEATSEESLGALQCIDNGTYAACGALLLDPNESKSAQVQLIVPRAGILHNFVGSFATVRGGVCTAGLVKGRPCNDDSDCTGMGNTCGTGICDGGSRDGFGCNIDDDCDGGSCIACELPNDGQVLSGVACTTTVAGVEGAPAVSPWGLAAIVVVLAGIGMVTIRRTRSAR